MKPLIRFRPKILLKYAGLAAAMLLLNFALPQNEPLSFPLFCAALFNGFDPFLASGAYLLASAASLSPTASLSASLQMGFLLIAVVCYKRFRRTPGAERFLFEILAQLPFIFLFPHTGYSLFPFGAVLQKLTIACFLLLLCVFFDGGMSALIGRAFRTRLTAGELAELALMWVFTGMGMVFALGVPVFYAISLTALLLSVVTLKRSAAVPFAVVLALPLLIVRRSAAPVAAYAVFACVSLLFVPYGKLAAGLSLFVSFAAAGWPSGLYFRSAAEIAFSLLSCFVPALLVLLLPEKFLKRLSESMLFYRERTLPRMAVNRSRRAVGEQLYEVSALFREIESAFRADSPTDRTAEQIKTKLCQTLCADCMDRRSCEAAHTFSSFEKLIAVGIAKGRVNLIDLPIELSAQCSNSAGLLFALNDLLLSYSQMNAELEAAREGRRLLADQAHGVSEILKEIALTESEEYAFSEEESRLSAALAKEGLLSTEIFVYGEGENFTATFTLEERVSAKKLTRIASEVLGFPLSLSEKLPLTADRACFVLKKRPNYDASFGIAARCKEGETASGDAHSVLKIDERRFLVALSDGMGSGEEARAVSDRTLSLLESFYKAKMPPDTVLSTVNSLIAFSSEERFSCVDLAAVDLDTGVADVVKIGSPPGFVLSGETLQVLEGESLPIGVLEAIHPACLRVEMQADDFLIFMSDGVTSAFGSASDLCAYLSRLRPLNPQSLAEEILKTALRRYRDCAEDDMTVVTVKLTKSA